MTRDEVEAAIRAAFVGVRLGSGVRLRQAAAIDDWAIDDGFACYTQAQFKRVPEDEVTDDWSLVPADTLRRDNMAHLDPPWPPAPAGSRCDWLSAGCQERDTGDRGGA